MNTWRRREEKRSWKRSPDFLCCQLSLAQLAVNYQLLMTRIQKPFLIVILFSDIFFIFFRLVLHTTFLLLPLVEFCCTRRRRSLLSSTLRERERESRVFFNETNWFWQNWMTSWLMFLLKTDGLYNQRLLAARLSLFALSHAHQTLVQFCTTELHSPLSHEWTSESERVEETGRVEGIEAATRTFRLNGLTLTFHLQTSSRTLIFSWHCRPIDGGVFVIEDCLLPQSPSQS